MNVPWKPPFPQPCPPPDQCTCGCEPCQCQECPPLCVDERLLDCWRQISAFKRMIEGIINEIGATQGAVGPAGPAGVAGPAGPAGAQGPAGMAVSYVGDTAPSNPSNGELWVKSDGSLHIYEDPPGQWVDISGGGAGVVGPMGPQGPQGVQGAQGPAGPQGAVGPAGSPGSSGQDGGASLTIGAVGTYALMSRMEDTKNSGPLLTPGTQQTSPQMFGNNSGTWQVVNYSFDAEMWANGVAGCVTYLMQRIS